MLSFLPFDLLTQLTFQRKVGVMYCRAGQSSEEDMYNNESSGPAFEEFLDLLGERVRLKGWEKYRAQLDNKSEPFNKPLPYTDQLLKTTLWQKTSQWTDC